MTGHTQKIVLTFLCLVALLTQLGLTPTPSPQSGVTVDNTQGNRAVEGMILSSSSTTAKVAVINLHAFWTNLMPQPASGSGTFVPANPLNGGQDIGGLYAAIGVVAPNQQAVWDWEFDAIQATSQTVVATPSLETGSPLAFSLNLLTVATAMVGATPSVDSAQAVVQAARLALKSEDFTAAVHDLQGQNPNPVAFASHFYKMLSDSQQRILLQQAMALLGVRVTAEVLEKLTTVVTIVQLAQMAADEILAIVQQTAAGEVIFRAVLSTAANSSQSTPQMGGVTPRPDNTPQRITPSPAKDDFASISVEQLQVGPTTMVTSDGLSLMPVWSPDGSHLAYLKAVKDNSSGGPPVGLWVSDADGKNAYLLSKGNYPFGDTGPFPPEWSPDGNRIATLWGDASGNPYTEIIDPARPSQGVRIDSAYAPAWSPDSQQTAVTLLKAQRSDIAIFGVDGSKKTDVTADGNSCLPVWTPDANRLLFLRGGCDHFAGTVIRYDPTKHSEEQLLMLPGPTAGVPLWSSDRHRVAWVSGGQLLAASIDGNGAPQRLSPTAIGFVTYSAAWSPNGSKLAYVDGPTEGQTDVWIVNATGTGRMQLTHDQQSITPAWSPDGTRIAISRRSSGSGADVAIIILKRQSETSPAPQATIAAQQTQIAALQTAVARQAQPTAAPVKPTLTLPTTPVAAARLFIQALVSGDINTALQLMPASTQATARGTLASIAGALRACSSSASEASQPHAGSQGGYINVQFTPPCGNYGQFYNGLPVSSPDGMSISQKDIDYWAPVNRYGNRPLAVCTVAVWAVNEQWKVYYVPSCLPVMQ